MAETKQLITPDKIIEVLKKIEKTSNVEIVEFETGPATGKGENWSSTLIRCDFTAKIDGQLKTFHWIGKFPPSSDRKAFNDAIKMGEKEAWTYARFIPDLKEFLKSHDLEMEIEFNFPACPHADVTGEDEYAFYMEDMKQFGFGGPAEVNKKLGLDVDHVQVVLDELAKLHATSRAYILDKAKDSTLKQALNEMELMTRDFVYTNQVEEAKVMLNEFSNAGMKGLYNCLRSLEDDGDNFVDPFKRFFEADDNTDQFDFAARHPDLDNGFNVMIHNDAWFNNMLFKYKSNDDSGSEGLPVPEKVSLVDLALMCWSSPAVDLSYFFFMSLEPGMRLRKQDDFLAFYHGRLNHYLQLFGLDTSSYSLSELKADYEARLMVGVMASSSSLPAVLLPADQAIDQTDFDWTDTEAMLEKAFELFKAALTNNPDIRERIRGNYLEALKKGILH